MNPAVFLDRDNTLIHNDGDLGDPAQVRLIQGAASAIASLRGLGYKVVVVSNQGGVARGKYTEADVDAVHHRVNDIIKTTSGTLVDRFYYCPYHPEGTVEKYRREHPWRKPAPGMLLQAAKDLELDLGQSWMVGDQLRDIEAGAAAGVRTILLRSDAEELTPLRLEQIATAQIQRAERAGAVAPNFTARNLIEAVRIIAQQRKPEPPDEMRVREKSARKWDAGAVRMSRQGQAGQPAPAPDAEVGAPAPAPAPAPTRPVSKPPARPARPFRPWGAEGLEPPRAVEPPTRRGESAASPAAPPSEPDAESAAVEEFVAPPAAAPPPAPAREPAPPPRAEPPVERPAAAAAAVVTPAAAVEAPPPAGASAAPATAPAATTAADPPRTHITADDAGLSDVTLRQILQELRNQRTLHNDFTFLRFAALFLQAVVIIVVLAGWALGQNHPMTFLGAMDTAIVLQLSVVAALLFDR